MTTTYNRIVGALCVALLAVIATATLADALDKNAVEQAVKERGGVPVELRSGDEFEPLVVRGTVVSVPAAEQRRRVERAARRDRERRLRACQRRWASQPSERKLGCIVADSSRRERP